MGRNILIMITEQELKAEVESRLEQFEKQYKEGETRKFTRRFVMEALGLECDVVGVVD